ncbi:MULTISPECIES: hypothetical protein [Bacillus cereus group]|uniref:Uncharacterized protein n=1 Tax=Bacillus thuringiensis TaxID=1428 RepID=A0A9X7AR30_BACTU|nr:hypothetical protein [Bacillus thuringiensis]MCQ6334962.1 hypothetical protein [Bacillus cereus]PFT49195.1 hypothetical protein COK72_06510 [Bacillus thuringiensis]
MKKKFITFALITGIALTTFGTQQSFAKSPPSKDCSDDTFDLRFLSSSPYDETDRRMKFSPSYIYMKTKYISVGGVRVWAKAWGKDASGGRSKTINSPGVTLLYNRVIEDHLGWLQEGAEASIAAEKRGASQVKGDWSPDYC